MGKQFTWTFQTYWAILGTSGAPSLTFFRHIYSRSEVQSGLKFGQLYLRKYQAKCYESLCVKGVTLYSGSKDTIVAALGKKLTLEQVKRWATGYVPNAFEKNMIPDVYEATMATQAIVEMQQN